jgi:hypothetical protein
MESFDVAVAFRVMIGRAPMRDAKPVQCFDKPRRSELSPVIGGQRHTGLASARGQPFQCRLLDRCAPFAECLPVHSIVLCPGSTFVAFLA